MTAIDRYQLATDSTDTWLDYNASDYCDILDNFFTFEKKPKSSSNIFLRHAARSNI
jgi:hypothetical protein